MAYVKASDRRRQYLAAARAVLSRDGVAGTTLRAVAAEAQVSIGTLYYIFPVKEEMITAVLEDVRAEVSAVFEATDTGAGLEHAIRHGLDRYWERLVVDDPRLALMRHELFAYALRTPGQEHLARWQIEGYTRIVSRLCQQAASNAGETCAVPFDTLARALVASVVGTVLVYLSDQDHVRSQQDLRAVADMLVGLAAPTVPGG
ncbi:TetR/AcrR family transcriptional regulator [Mumia zhuanghuii]|uniref:TetR/AcrR family transcriptional regulator n=2 Tax=Mumia TaxID=1546255 RepID=A0ABW1QL66_9ACTN|nr:MULTISPECIES: TetR/AcrR family transcriptional regulator [Mumia]KAA1425013.1 TetR/AcrR family transcriptional regulator [Mumia zhuanghuii]